MKELHSAINKQVYKWLDERGIPFEYEMGGRVIVMAGENSDDWFDYHQTHHTVNGFNWMVWIVTGKPLSSNHL